MSKTPAVHTHFVIERTYGASPAEVFHAWADTDAKRQWFDCHVENTAEYSLDFRPLGRETHKVISLEHGVQLIEKVFFDIVPDSRIVFAYDISLNERRLSVSLVTVETTACAGCPPYRWPWF
jgi:uncharacterized protein YndB with AHSA1/START domain